LDRRLGGPQSRSGRGGKEKKIPAPAETRTPDHGRWKYYPMGAAIIRQAEARMVKKIIISGSVSQKYKEDKTFSVFLMKPSGTFTLLAGIFLFHCFCATHEISRLKY
jgi:hypothetical protein